MQSRDWSGQAACRGLDAAIFYPPSEEEAQPAQDVCAACGVRQACLEFALATRERDGVWGGATERDRRRIVRQRRRARREAALAEATRSA